MAKKRWRVRARKTIEVEVEVEADNENQAEQIGKREVEQGNHNKPGPQPPHVEVIRVSPERDESDHEEVDYSEQS